MKQYPRPMLGPFEWIFDSALSEWLRSGTGLFWISGKAGSGKSTLMKFLADKRETQALLEEWASAQKVAVVPHYFWSQGTRMQRSTRGLLQSLLYDIFSKDQDCIRTICPSRWDAVRDRGADASGISWTESDLKLALEALAESQVVSFKVCFLIDGLDEYGDEGGEHENLCNLFMRLIKSPNFKFCVSSRPLNVFTVAFRECPSLAVHDFTREDIAHFAKPQIESHSRWQECALDETQRQWLISEITNRSQGVFLWVYLVVRDLGRGLTNDDTFRDLQRGLDLLPSSLEAMFKRILDSVDKVYHQKMAGMFLIALAADEPLELEVYLHHEDEYEDENYAIHRPIGPNPFFIAEKSLSLMRRRINARSQGLLEVVHGGVVFLHRTVGNFLRTKEIQEFLVAKAPRGFNPEVSILKAFVSMFKSNFHRPDVNEYESGFKFRDSERHKCVSVPGILMHYRTSDHSDDLAR
jgi:hypothetical protein